MNTFPLKLLALGAFTLVSCNALTGVNDLEVVEGAGGTSGTGGGGSAGAAGSGTCEAGQKSCDGQCVAIDAPAFGCTETGCEPCAFENATATCADLGCQFDSCKFDWLDCDESLGCETPVDDLNDCTQNVCDHPAKSEGAPCDQNGGTQCDGAGNCIRCSEGTHRCDGNQPQVCDADGNWNNLAACQLPTPACSRGYCAGVSNVATGDGHSCALLSDKGVKCWGDNARGQLGNGAMGGIETRPVATLDISADALFAGARHTCAITHSGELECWGANDVGQIGNDVFGGEQLGPMAVGSLVNVQFAALGSNFTCAHGDFNSTRGVFCWGGAAQGQLGNGNTSNTYAPTDRVELSDAPILSLSAGDSHACVVLESGEVHCWGNNSNGQLGTLTGTQENNPYKVTVDIASSVFAGGWHTCALTVGGLYCWGADTGGQVGDGDTTHLKILPTLVGDVNDVWKTISAGGQHTCGVQGTTAHCWGRNNVGQVGDGSLLDRLSPTGIDAIVLGTQGRISAGGSVGTSATELPPRGHTCAIASDGNVWCWGSNDVGQLGTGDTTPSDVPKRVSW